MLVSEALHGEILNQMVGAFYKGAVENFKGRVSDTGVQQKDADHESSSGIALVSLAKLLGIYLSEYKVDSKG